MKSNFERAGGNEPTAPRGVQNSRPAQNRRAWRYPAQLAPGIAKSVLAVRSPEWYPANPPWLYKVQRFAMMVASGIFLFGSPN